MSIEVLICTHGDHRLWHTLALQRAYPSAHEQAKTSTYHLYDGTLAQARNQAAEQATADWLCFLDADDELAPGYIQAMQNKIGSDPRPGGSTESGAARQVAKESSHPTTAASEATKEAEQEARAPVASDRKKGLLIPQVQYLHADGDRLGGAHFPNAGRWPHLNVGVIGTLVQRGLFLEVGGFREWKSCEDWDLWLRCWDAGAELVFVPDAVYVAHLSYRSRNSDQSDYCNIWAEHVARQVLTHGEC